MSMRIALLYIFGFIMMEMLVPLEYELSYHFQMT